MRNGKGTFWTVGAVCTRWHDHALISSDDLPVIRDNIRKGFLETQSKVNSFLTNLKKKIDGDGEEEEDPAIRRPTGRTPTGFSSGMAASRRGEEASRRSGDRDRYDADPEVLGDDFAGLRMVDETSRLRKIRSDLIPSDTLSTAPISPPSRKPRSFQAYSCNSYVRGTSCLIPRRSSRRD